LSDEFDQVDDISENAPSEAGDGATPDLQGTLVDLPVQPFGRLVTNRMATTAKYAQQLAEEVSAGSKGLSVFGQPNSVANATELEALSGLGGSERRLYQLRFAPSPLASLKTEQAVLSITPGQQHIMAEAAEYLRTKQSRRNVTIEGLVVNLSRDRNSGPGEIVVQGIADDSGKARRFHMEITAEDYSEALHAHTHGFRVVVRGDLDTRGTWKWLRHVRSVAIVPGLSGADDD
jgi:hypothetical protein